MTARDLAAIVKGIAPVLRDLTQQLHTKIDALQTLARGEPGPMGPAGPEGPIGRDGRDGLPGLQGEKGTNGIDGQNGVDGLGFDDMSLLYDGERTFTFRFQRASNVKEFPVKVEGLPLYRGVFKEGKTYERGDSTTWGGSEWHCHEATTTKPGDGSKSWTLKVKRGRDGRDGQDATSIPVVKVR